MKKAIGAITALTCSAALCATAAAAPITVNVRVEGANKTIFDANVKTTAHSITRDSTGPHPCDGTNNGANKTPGPTVTGALDDASKVGHFSWTATWSNSFNDFFVNGIGPNTGTTATQYWIEALNFRDTTAGGCQVELHAGDQVLFYFVNGTAPKYALKLTGPKKARAHHKFRLRVVDGRTGKPVKGAKVSGHRTNAKGFVTLSLGKGTKHLRATFPNAVRSNVVVVRVAP